MRGSRVAAAAASLFVLLMVAAGAVAAPPDDPVSCRIDRPAGLWDEDYVTINGNGPWDTHLHHGLNSDWNMHTRPIGRVRAVMIFVDFSDAQAINANPNQGGRDWRLPQSYWDLLEPGVELFNKSSNGRFQLDVDLVPKWFRMLKPSNQYGMNRTQWTIPLQQAYMREAVEIADAEVDFTPYDIVYLMPPRNATAIQFSPELNFYQEPLSPDGKVIRNGVTYGNDIFTWGHRIINHETGHDISFPESYDGSGGPTHGWVGGWDFMGDPLGHAPDVMAWNKWKVGWLDDADFGCLSTDGTADFNLTSLGTAPDGTSKKGVVVKTSATTAVVAELREPVGADATSTLTPGPHRLCDWGVLVYKVDVVLLNSFGTIRVVDQMPASTQAGCTRDLDIATLGKGQGDGPSRYEDPTTGTILEVREIDDEAGTATLRVTRAATRIQASPGTGLAPQPVTFTASHFSPPAGATYSWDFGGGETAAGATAQHTFGAGRHTVTLTVRDSAGTVIGTATKTVSIFNPAVGDITLNAPSTADTNASATVTTSFPDASQDITVEVYRRINGTAHPLVASGTGTLSYSSPVAATDIVVACANAGQSCLQSGSTLALDAEGAPTNLRTGVPVAHRGIEWRAAGEWVDLWDGQTLARWEYAGSGSMNRNFLTSLVGAGGSATNAGVLFYGAREYKDFELSVDYRASATNSNGGVLLRFPRPANMADADLNGYQVAVLDNGTAATGTGAIRQERPALSFAPTIPALAKPNREWNTLHITAVRHHITVRLNGTVVSSYDDATRNNRAGYIGLENASTGVMYRHVKIRELAPDTTPPTVTITTPFDGQLIAQNAVVASGFACADDAELASCTATLDGAPISSGDPLPTSAFGPHTLTVTAADAEGHTTSQSVTYSVGATAAAPVGGVVAATLALALGPPPSFGALQPGVERTYTAETTATVTSTAGDATLSVSDPGRLSNGAFTLTDPLEVVGAPKTWTGPTTNESVTIGFRQRIGPTEPLRTGTYSKTLTFTLSTTTP